MNPLDGMTWEERFWVTFQAFLTAEMRAEDAERKFLHTKGPVTITPGFSPKEFRKLGIGV